MVGVFSSKLNVFLLSAGADAQAQNLHGKTPLHYALQRRCQACADLLLAGDADEPSVESSKNRKKGQLKRKERRLEALRREIGILLKEEYELFASIEALRK